MSRLIDKIDYNTQVKIGNMWYIAKPVGKDSLKFRIKSAIEVLKGKAIADKLEKEYSAMLTESDENECDYKRVLKENEELKADNYELNNRISDLLDNIPVQKVKDKIEEILNNGEYRIIFEGDAEFPDEATCIDAQKYIKLEKLQELLEGRK